MQQQAHKKIGVGVESGSHDVAAVAAQAAAAAGAQEAAAAGAQEAGGRGHTMLLEQQQQQARRKVGVTGVCSATDSM